VYPRTVGAALEVQNARTGIWFGSSKLIGFLCHQTVVCGYLVYCVYVFVCLFVVRLRISQRRKKIGGVKLRMHVRLLSAQVFSHFGELWLAWSHGSGINSGMYVPITHWSQAPAPGEARWGRVSCRVRCMHAYGSELC